MNIESVASDLNLGGYLLLASPAMRDPQFRRTAVLLSAHNREDGAHGLILDRPVGRRVRDLVTGPEDEIAELPVHQGGPCAPDLLAFAIIDWELDGRATVFLCPTWEIALEAHHRGKRVRAFAGHAGWSSGQLENELRHDSWLVTTPQPDLFKQDFAIGAAWTGHLRGMGPEMSLLAHIPQDPWAN